MASPAVPYLLSKLQQQGIVLFCRNCVESLSTNWNLRAQFLLRDQIYYREIDRTAEQARALAANYAGDTKKMQNVVVPIVMPQVETALAYHAGVFLSGYPIFGVASDPANIDAAIQMESVISDNSVYYGWTRQFIMFLRDALKYNLAAMEVTWKRKRIFSSINDPAAGINAAKQTETYYQGNRLKRLDPYNLIWDKRVLTPVDIPCDGEFVGYTEIMSRIMLKQLFLDLPAEFTMNGKEAYENGAPITTITGVDSWFYVPQVNPLSFVGNSNFMGPDWMTWAMIDPTSKGNIRYNNSYEVTTIYGKIIPQDFNIGVPRRNQPQIWKFILVNRNTLIYAERQTNAHGYFPILFCQPNEDGLGYQTKSLLDNAAPFQALSSALWNAGLAAERRKVFDRLLYDPSRVRKEDIDSVSEVSRIPVKQSAYGKPVSEAVYAFPYRDDGIASNIQMAAQMGDMADVANGQNRVQRGQFQKGNKTKQEFDTTMQGSNSRQQLQAQGLESGTFTPMKEILKSNILQYQPAAQYYNVDQKKVVDVNPQDLRAKMVTFKMSDGLLPSEKLVSGDLLQIFMQVVSSSPLMQSEFDMLGAFAYWMKLNGAAWFDDFKRKPEDQARVMQQITAQEQASKTPPQQPQQTQQVGAV